VESPWVEQEIVDRQLTPEMTGLARHFHREGFAVIPGVVPGELVGRVLDDLVGAMHGNNRLQDAWRHIESVRQLALLPTIVDAVRTLYGREPVPFQTLNFEYGTQQEPHSDTIHFSSIPQRYMCGVWIALEDVDEGNGPLFYHPGSQRLQDPFMQRFSLHNGLHSYGEYVAAQEELMSAHQIPRLEFHAKAGDALIWSANLVHGGQAITESGRTRWSQVTHYFFEDCVYVTPLLSDADTGTWYVRDNLINIATGAVAAQSLDGDPVCFEPLGDGVSRIHRGQTRGKSLEERIAEQTVQELRAAVVATETAAKAHAAEAAALRASRSYRLGNAVVRAVAMLRTRFARRPDKPSRPG
jgi:Phytanoyl-CoA dioxygenase (PhyH)